jgi:4-alpha-glucanotransferase
MNDLTALESLAYAMGVHRHYTDGLGRPVEVPPETLVRVCASLGAAVARPADAEEALRAYEAGRAGDRLPPVLVAWDGSLPAVRVAGNGGAEVEIRLEDGGVADVEIVDSAVRLPGAGRLPLGYHRLTVVSPAGTDTCVIVSAPVQAWRRPGMHRSWGVGGQLAAFRSARSRSLGDLRDLETVCRWVGDRNGDLVMVLPLLPTFNSDPIEPSPYSPVSRLFWSELMLDLGDAHRPARPADTLDVRPADAEVRAALRDLPLPDPALLDDELVRYARFRGAQARLGRNWRDWPAPARDGDLSPEHIDSDEERFHLIAQSMARRQLGDLRRDLEADGLRLGLDLAVGVHPDGYDPWSRQHLFADGMSVGAPPDGGFPSGQDWGFHPVLPDASRREGHRYLAASIAHQAAVSGVLRVDHIMAWTRLYWIPHGLGKDEGTYVSYPADELFAVLTLESQRNRCEVVGENLGTVPPEIGDALPRHRIWGMYLAQFTASEDPDMSPATDQDMALIGTHDTPTFAGWLSGVDIGERVRCELLDEEAVPAVREERMRATGRLAGRLNASLDDPRALLSATLEWLGESGSPLVVAWLEDLWLEEEGVNLPGTRSSERPNWQRPMSRLLEEALGDPDVEEMARTLARSRAGDSQNSAD